MTYGAPIDSTRCAPGVCVSYRIIYQNRAYSGNLGNELAIPICWGLSPNPGRTARFFPYEGTIGDLEVSVTEKTSTFKQAVTRFKVENSPIVSEGGNTLLSSLLGGYLFTFVEGVVMAAAASNHFIGPLLRLIREATCRLIGRLKREKMIEKGIRLGFIPWWSLKVWNGYPGAIPLRLGIGYVMGMDAMSSKETELSGSASYEVVVTAETGSMWGRPIGMIRQSSEFEVSWSDVAAGSPPRAPGT